MIIHHTVSALRASLQNHRDKNETIVFVPTMGALHNGHISLINEAKRNGDIVVCSIFVNPKQFNQSNDLKDYPRTPEKDHKMLEEASCHYLFSPEVDEIYPPGHKNIENVDFGELTSSLEAINRPGHFDGVINVVKRLFEIVEPNKACFGLKDFQQISIIKRMVSEFNFNIEIIGCPIKREESGLAMSSRNELLSPEMRELASQINEILVILKEESEHSNIGEIKALGHQLFDQLEGFKLEYLAFVDPISFKPIKDNEVNVNTIVLVAIWLDGIRLLDNIFLEGRSSNEEDS